MPNMPRRATTATDGSRSPPAGMAAPGNHAGRGAATTPRTLVIVAAGLCALGGLALPIDVPVARWIAERPLPGEVYRLLDISEAFAQGWGVAGILLAALVLDAGLWQAPAGAAPDRPRSTGIGRGWLTPRGTPAVARLLGMAVTGGLLADLVKLVVRRVRPRAVDLEAATGALATFGTSLVAIPDPGSADFRSFPSGHAAAAAGLAAALAQRYPRGRRLFVVFAVLAALQRVSSSAHYPSDVCFGAALGCVGAAVALRLVDRNGSERAG